jgi:hypothetical protein
MKSESVNVETILREIAAKHNGILRAEDVVREAESELHPLHSRFDWNDTTAAAKWRLHEARNMIRVVVTSASVGGRDVTVRAFVSLTPNREDDGGGYRQTLVVMRNKDDRAQLLADALADFKRFEEKYQALEELVEVFEAAKRVASNSILTWQAGRGT